MQALDGVERIRKLGIRTAVVTAAVVAITAAALVLNSGCFADTKTNLCEASGRRCAPGQVCAAEQDACIPIGGCGDGIVDTTRGEVCDDGNIENGDGCNRDCGGVERCGDGVVDVEVGEECDSMGVDTLTCNQNCRGARCGDGYLNMAAGEECDTGPGNPDTADCVGEICKSSRCGDRYQNFITGEACDSGGDSEGCNGPNAGTMSCKLPSCGDGYVNPAYKVGRDGSYETCDEGGNSASCNGNWNDSGKGNCRRPECGDGYWNPEFITPGGDTEECDDGKNTRYCNGKDDDNDSSTNIGVCQISRCGDGYHNDVAGEECDPGLTSDHADDVGCDEGQFCTDQCSECIS